jgi:hypothetical protein
MLNEAVPALFLHPAAGIPFDDFGVEMAEVLALVGIDPHSGHDETVVEPPHGGIGEKREQGSVGKGLIGCGIDLCMRRSHESRYGLYLLAPVVGILREDLEVFRPQIIAHGKTGGEEKQLAALGEGNPVAGLHASPLASTASRHFQLGEVQNVSRLIGIE